MTQVLKRIVRAEISGVLIEDLKVFLKRSGDSIDLIGPDVLGKPIRTLEEVCRSISLDSLLSLGHLTLWDENGDQITGTDMSRATNLSTLIDSGVGINTGSASIAVDENSLSITFGTAFSYDDYTVVVNLRNYVDDPPSIYTWSIQAKTSTGFTVLFSGPTDSANYIVEWVAV